MAGPPNRPAGDTRRRDAAFVLPAFGTLLLLPPFLNLFNRGLLVFGIPLEAVYLFTVWLALILGAFAMTRRRPDTAEDPAPGDDG